MPNEQFQWPDDLVDSFVDVFLFAPEAQEAIHFQRKVVREVLDEAAKYAVWRAAFRKLNLFDAYNMSYRPIDRAVFQHREGVLGIAFATLFPAIHQLHVFVTQNKDTIQAVFEDEAKKYKDIL